MPSGRTATKKAGIPLKPIQKSSFQDLSIKTKDSSGTISNIDLIVSAKAKTRTLAAMYPLEKDTSKPEVFTLGISFFKYDNGTPVSVGTVREVEAQRSFSTNPICSSIVITYVLAIVLTLPKFYYFGRFLNGQQPTTLFPFSAKPIPSASHPIWLMLHAGLALSNVMSLAEILTGLPSPLRLVPYSHRAMLRALVHFAFCAVTHVNLFRFGSASPMVAMIANSLVFVPTFVFWMLAAYGQTNLPNLERREYQRKLIYYCYVTITLPVVSEFVRTTYYLF